MDSGLRTGNLTELVERHSGLLYRYAFRLTGSAADAEDLTQQAFLSAYMKLDQLREPSHAKAWLCTIVRNTYLKGLRSEKRSQLVSLENVAEPAGAGPADVEWNQQELQTVLNELPEDYRTPLILFYFEEFSYQEIASQMEVPIGTVMSRLARAKALLRRRLLSRVPATTTKR